MNMADRIHQLRKEKNISQEELADRLGVSRQAVSKWESEQSNPDIDKILLMSDFFEVTTDYLLKGIEPVSEEKRVTYDAIIFAMIGSALNLIGVAVSCAVWYEKQVAAALVIGLVFILIGCIIFGIGLLRGTPGTANKAKRMFWTINVWMILFMPLSLVYNIIFARSNAPYPLLAEPIIALPIWFCIYFAIGISVTTFVQKRFR